MNSVEELNKLAREFRYIITDMICRAGSGHLGGALSLVEIIVTLFFKEMKIDSKNPKWENRDRFVLSKGHAGPVLYTALAYKGFFPVEWLATLNKPGTRLPSHCDQNKTPGVEQTAGSLGQGLSVAVGKAIACKMNKSEARVYCVIGDGESQEGQIWEAAMYAANRKLDNLVVITDFNKMQIDGTIEEINSIEPLADKWRSFGWAVYEMNGHDFEEIYSRLQDAKKVKGKPVMLIAHTVKSKGNACTEGQVASHSIKVPDSETYKKFLDGLGDLTGIKLPY